MSETARTDNIILTYVEGGSEDERALVKSALADALTAPPYYGGLHAYLVCVQPQLWAIRAMQSPLLTGNPDHRQSIDAWRLIADALTRKRLKVAQREPLNLTLDVWSGEEPISFSVTGLPSGQVFIRKNGGDRWNIVRRCDGELSPPDPGDYESPLHALRAVQEHG